MTLIEPLRKCNSCGIEAHTEGNLEKFVYKKKLKHCRVNTCKECANKYNRDRRRNNKESYSVTNKKYRLKKNYGISVEEYDKRMSSSDCCEICETKNSLCYDHDHKTMQFRGVLCRVCNKGLGSFGDTLEGLKKAVKYLEKEKNNER